MKKAINLFLLVPVLLQAFGLTLFFLFAKYNSIRRLEEHRPEKKSHLVTLCLSRDAFDRAKTSHDEIRLNGEMYDIVEYIRAGETIELLAWKDDGEARIVNLLENLFSADDKDENFPSALHVQKVAQSFYTLPANNNGIFSPQINPPFYVEVSAICCSGIIAITSPPPETRG